MDDCPHCRHAHVGPCPQRVANAAGEYRVVCGCRAPDAPVPAPERQPYVGRGVLWPPPAGR